MGGIADRWIELGERAEPLVAFGRGEREMGGRRLRRGDVLVVRQEGGLFLAGDVQHMNAFSRLARELDQALRAHEGGGGIAPDRMRARIAFDAQVHALAQTVLVLGVEGGAPADRLEHVAHAVVVLDQQRAGGGAHEHFHGGDAGQHFQFAQGFGVLAGGPDIKGEVAMHAVMRALDLVGDRGGIGGARIGIRHLEYRGDAAEHRAARARFQVFLVGQAGLAEMDVAVDHARQQVQAAAVDHFAGMAARKIADRRETAAADAEIARGYAVVVDHGAALEDQVVGFSHAGTALKRALRPRT